jgi:hypothetical protein
VPPLPARQDGGSEDTFVCTDESLVACIGGVHHSCPRVGEFLELRKVDCEAQGLVCVPELECATCVPDKLGCDEHRVVRCSSDGEELEVVEECDLEAGFTCDAGRCVSLCVKAQSERSYVGCEFFAVDLDNATISEIHDASRQQFAVVVSNLHDIPIEVTVEANEAPFGEPARAVEVSRSLVPPGDLEVFALPRREVDGSTPDGYNDGTHTAVSSNAYRVTASRPIIAYQFNPLDNVDVFSNEASLLLPTSAIGSNYTVVGWPQTIGDSDEPSQDFDSTTSDEDLRAFLTVVGTRDGTRLTIDLGPDVVRVLGAGPIPESGPGDSLVLDIGPFDVVNLETQGFMADFTGSVIRATEPVSVFVGSEASDVPIFEGYETRQCCADHLEEQLLPDETLGTQFVISRMPSRAAALNDAFLDPTASVAEGNEPEWIRVVAVSEEPTEVTATLPRPYNRFVLQQHQGEILRADQDFMLEADRPIAILQALPSQEVVGIPKQYPGGDPAIIAVPPVEQYRDSYIFLTPDKYAFDFITITAGFTTRILLDGTPLPDHCTTHPADGIEREPDDPDPVWVIHRCQLSFPDVVSTPVPKIEDGLQSDGVHTIVADQPVGLFVYGFDRFVSYAYAGGLNLDRLY